MSILTSRNILAVTHQMPLGSWCLRKVSGNITFISNSCLISVLVFFSAQCACFITMERGPSAKLLIFAYDSYVNFSEFLSSHLFHCYLSYCI